MSYVVLVGINYRPTPQSAEKRAEPGVTVTDLSAPDARAFLSQDIIAKVE